MNEARLALSRVQMRESFVMQETADIFVSHLSRFAQTDMADAAALEAALASSIEQAYSFEPQAGGDRKPFIYNDGMAIIPIHGALINRFGGAWGFVTGYNYIRRVMNAALEDEDVKLIVFDVDSPGGEAAGCFELANEIRASRAGKPSIAIVDSLSASAGYALASAATRMVATPSSKIGSIGVVAMHVDLSGALDQAGIKITYIEAPEDGLKTAGSPYQPLSDAAKADFQRSVNRTYDDFVALVAANRGMGDAEVRETKAKVFRSDEALALRLIDEVKTPSEAVSAYVAELANEEPIESEDEDMTTATTTGSEATSTAAAAAPAAPAATSQADIQAAIAADRERMTAIKGLPEAAKRPKLADTLAMGGYTVDQATSLLAAAAEETAAAPAAPTTTTTTTAPAVDGTNHLDAAMSTTTQPNVGAGGEGVGGASGGEPTPEDAAAAILKDHTSVTGHTYGEK